MKYSNRSNNFRRGDIEKKQDTYADTHQCNGLGNELQLAITLYQGIYPTQRPPTPKQSTSSKLLTTVKKMNKILPTFIQQTENFLDIHVLMYFSAFICTKETSQDTEKNKSVTQVPRWQKGLEGNNAT